MSELKKSTSNQNRNYKLAVILNYFELFLVIFLWIISIHPLTMNYTSMPFNGTFNMNGNLMECITNITNDIFVTNCTPVPDKSIVDSNYLSNEDVFDGLLNALFPIFFVILFNIKNSSSPKKILLPILDDILYNTVTWVIPLVVSLIYDDLIVVKIFVFVNMGLHTICTLTSLITNMKLNKMDEKMDEKMGGTINQKAVKLVPKFIFHFLVFFPVIVIPIFWIIYIIEIKHYTDPISILFIGLFSLVILSAAIFIIYWIITTLFLNIIFLGISILSFLGLAALSTVLIVQIYLIYFKTKTVLSIVLIILKVLSTVFGLAFISYKVINIGNFLGLIFTSIPFMVVWIVHNFITHQVWNPIKKIYIILVITMIISSIISIKNNQDFHLPRIPNAFIAVYFYIPNILQTLLIMLKWPVNFYFIKICLFILILSLTRNVSYFTEEIPRDFLATSTTYIQYRIKNALIKRTLQLSVGKSKKMYLLKFTKRYI
jgi:hypothetical protein